MGAIPNGRTHERCIMTTQKDGKKTIDIISGNRAINWYESSKVPVNAEPTADPWELAFSTQTSVITGYYGAMENVFNINVKHRGKSATATMTIEALAQHPESVLDMAHDEICSLMTDTSNPNEYLNDNKVIGALFSTLFVGYKPPYAIGGTVNVSEYSIGTHLPNYSAAYPNTKAFSTGQKLNQKAKNLPGIDKSVKHPVSGRYTELYFTIMDLNDNHRWTREQIADWIETLDIDTTFKVGYTESNKEEL